MNQNSKFKICTSCHKEFKLSRFYKCPGGYKSWCKKCHSQKSTAAFKLNPNKTLISYKYNLKKNFNITIEEYDKLRTMQNNRCAICEKDKKKRLHVDHNHITGKIRGLLCLGCNTALGNLNADFNSDLLYKAIKYVGV